MMQKSSSARARLTAADFAFVEAVLVEELASPLRSLQQDPEAMTTILDLDAVHQAVLGNEDVPPSLHLYILVRHAFRNCGIEDAGVADEVAGGLMEKLGLSEGARTFHFMCLIRNVANEARFHIQAAAGDAFLILNGNYQVIPEADCEVQDAANPGDIPTEDGDSLNPISERCLF